MGIIFKAQDLNLDRFVALKFLPTQLSVNEEEKIRFIQEAKTASAFDHPNICTIYEINETEDGQIFIAMACYDGDTLKDQLAGGPMSVQAAIDMAKQLAAGLRKAHEKGIVHRDIKPGNIIVTDDNIVKILDFGISKLQRRSNLTKPGTVIGTPGYMSPEQTLGEEVDHRTDIWSAGIVLYEMLTGQFPFNARNDASLMYAVVNEDPVPIQNYNSNIPTGLQNIIEKALQKDPAQRFQNCEEMIDALENLHRFESVTQKTQKIESRESIPSIAVMPFRDISEDKDQAYFCEGLTETLINKLSRLKDLRVVSRNTVYQLSEKNTDAIEIGRQLHTQSVVTGSVRKSGNLFRISVQLISTSDDHIIWAEEFERELKDVFSLQDEIARSVVNSLQIKLIGKTTEISSTYYTDNVDAYNEYLKGRFYWNRRTADSLKKSIRFFNAAIEIDPDYALAYSGLADVYTVLGLYGAFPPKQIMTQAKEAGQRAISIDGNLAEAHISLACIQAVYDWDWKNAAESFQKGIALKPEYAIAHQWYAVNSLAPQQCFDEAKKEIFTALEHEPISLVINTTAGLIHYYSQEYDEAVSYYRKALELDPNYAVTHFFLGQAFSQKKRYGKAMEHFQTALKSYGESTNMLAAFGNTAAQAGKPEIASKVLNKLFQFSKKIYVSAYDVACIYAGLGERDKAFSWLKKACEEHAYLLIYLKVDPVLDALREEPAFTNLVKMVFEKS